MPRSRFPDPEGSSIWHVRCPCGWAGDVVENEGEEPRFPCPQCGGDALELGPAARAKNGSPSFGPHLAVEEER